MMAKVYKSTGSWYVVKTAEGELWNARLKGILRLDGITSTNPIAVGDIINIEPEDDLERTAVVTEIQDRRNYINRQSPSHRMQHNIVASNIDQSLLLVTLKEPRTSQGFVDRWLVTCEAYHIPAVLLFNKADLYRKKETEKFEAWREMYEAIGYRVIRMSVATGEGVEEVKALLQGKISLLSGHSGVGKSSFLNAILPELRLKTQDVSGWSGKGTHTTTFAEMFDLPAEPGLGQPGAVIDTPGMKEFGLVDISRAELSGYFPEMRVLAGECQFNNCLHAEEPGCVVKLAVMEGRIAEDRYISYRTILDSIDDKNY
ncbi:MAG: ribosome small subunit-dependent GTPase A [Sphingobacteriales bacterium 50-39]|nr:ribosome small subunit-dependent GTPase A [Sphingobacteriales bacterium]OJW54881.1 MAG: ribosome small subunit-dependent GTPase A [Sphingobacteriales bacterium 50-39]